VLIILGFVLLLVLPAPWNWLGLAVLALSAVEIYVWHRTVRGTKKVVGPDAFIGRHGVVLSSTLPGQIRLDGEIWEARCDRPARAGDTVRVAGHDGLTLIVETTILP
jgi:membrane protein implicated in regulation of membrane protease activity